MGILSKFKNGFRKGSDLLQGALSKVSGNKALDESDLLELEEALYESDFGVESTEEIVEKLKKFIEVRKHSRELIQMKLLEKCFVEF